MTLTTPGVAADSNGLFHGLGDHASNSFSVDGQAITDQQSKVFSNQLPCERHPVHPSHLGRAAGRIRRQDKPCHRGDHALGPGCHQAHGQHQQFLRHASARLQPGFDLSYGGKNWGNFFEADGLNTGRFLDPPEFTVFHAKGNEENFFDRVDYSFTPADSIHLDLNYSRSWFQTPNSYDNLNVQNVVSGGASANPVFANVGDTDQRSQIETFNISPTYTRIVSQNSVFNLGAYARKDFYNYYPSDNPLADLGPANLQTSSISQYRTLLNTGVHADLLYANGINNIKAGAEYEQTFLREHDNLGVVDSTYNSPCVDVDGNPLPGYSDPSDCDSVTAFPNPNYLDVLAPLRPDARRRLLQLLRPHRYERTGDLHRRPDQGRQLELQPRHPRRHLQRPAARSQAEPRLGVAYNVKPSKHSAERLVCAHAGDALQRKPGALKRGMR